MTDYVTCPRCQAQLDEGITPRGCALCRGEYVVDPRLAFMYRLKAIECLPNYNDIVEIRGSVPNG